MTDRITSFLGQSWQDFRSEYSRNLESGVGMLDGINSFLLTHGGKQLRPMMTLLVAKALRGFCSERTVTLAAAVEMLHMSTLLHDDVLDAASTRRGVPTVVATYNPTVSVLVGDFWLSRVVDIIVRLGDSDIMSSFSRCLGDLARGEMLQMMKAESLDTTEDDYRRIIFDKTASLFVTLARSAARVVSASDEEMAAVTSYAEHVGIAFQVMDDIMDYSPQLSLGKPTGQDVLEKKITAPLLGAFAGAPAGVAAAFREKMRTPSPSLAGEAIELVRRWGGFEYAYALLKREIEAAKSAMDAVPDSEAKDCLIQLADYMAVRCK